MAIPFRMLLQSLCPHRCVLCDDAAAVGELCRGCLADLPASGPACRRCAAPLARAAPACGRCLTQPPPLQATLAACEYRFPADALVTGLKFGRELRHASAMAAAMTAMAAPIAADLDCLVPVPLYRRRHWQRGFNQAAEIAAALGPRIGLPVRHALLRQRHTQAQSRLTRPQRLGNVAAAFRVSKPLAAGTAVGLVDDVVTTGATLGAAARALTAAGAGAVTALVFARAD